MGLGLRFTVYNLGLGLGFRFMVRVRGLGSN
jgi:hypothetical protein